MAKLTPSQIYARGEAKRAKIQQRLIEKQRKAQERQWRAQARAEARASIKRSNTLSRDLAKNQKKREKEQINLLHRKQKARTASNRKTKRQIKRVWRRLI